MQVMSVDLFGLAAKQRTFIFVRLEEPCGFVMPVLPCTSCLQGGSRFGAYPKSICRYYSSKQREHWRLSFISATLTVCCVATRYGVTEKESHRVLFYTLFGVEFAQGKVYRKPRAKARHRRDAPKDAPS